MCQIVDLATPNMSDGFVLIVQPMNGLHLDSVPLNISFHYEIQRAVIASKANTTIKIKSMNLHLVTFN